jgi:hypothetical protein
MWDVLTWHNGTLSVAWWAIVVLVLTMIAAAGASSRRG